ncbi:hypothetical protein ASC64_03285 [Nocardioides sp. Root122]|uniref:hypothetical protein n=1 Tax=Nocardioides TaxID=1839 RepID=UPI0007031A65|nr:MULTISPECIES: hypothetical protein [Nocardioides]KQV77852.1 hypothetical protein ASC64_03285 [Nocardioides sp. Root122]MCK9822334.1 hypothetical protein [Nocardioides cavernae]
MNDDDLSPMPTPYAEEPQLVPGGVDAIEDDPADNGLPRDLSTDDNPAVDDTVPDEIAQPDDKQQEPDDSGDQEADTTRDSAAAGQEAEDGSPEPPA